MRTYYRVFSCLVKPNGRQNIMFKSFIIINLFFISLQFVEAADTVVEANSLENLGLSKNCDFEPVFKGRACIYEANRRAKETIVFVHGLNAYAARWYEQIAAFKDRYHIITFDLPGFGQSSRGNKLYSPTNYAQFIRYVKLNYIKRPFYLVGHSMGGAVSLRYSAMYPNDVKRLILADVGGILHQYSYAKSVAFKWVKYFAQISDLIVPGLNTMPAMHELANLFFQNLEWLPISIRDALKIPELRAIILQGNAVTIAGAAVSSENFSGAIRSNKIATLIIWGEYDLVTPVRTAEILLTRLSNSYLKIISRAAHSSMSDQPRAFNDLIAKHISASDSELIAKRWVFRPFKKSNRIGRCENQQEKYFEGDYLRIELYNCRKAFLNNVNVGSMFSKNSAITISKSQFLTKDIAITLFDSSLEITASNITAQIGIQTVRSHIDVAGVDFNIAYAAVNNLGNSDAVFSVSLVNGKHLHTYKDFTVAGKI